MGDPSGIGPEIIVRAWRQTVLETNTAPVAIGHPEVFRQAATRFAPELQIAEIATVDQATALPQVLCCLPAGEADARQAIGAGVSAVGGQAAYEAVVCAAQLALTGQVDAICTAPLSKAALHQAGHDYPGHTELLGELCGAPEVAMMLYLPAGEAVSGPHGLGVVHVTLHMALRDVFSHLTVESILATCQLAHAGLGRLQAGPPRLAVCALNPHGGESGLFGDEESRLVEPAVALARQAGMQVAGPLPADTVMIRAAGGEFDGVVALYHDQGHIALKLLGMHRAVNVTLGLPIVRTSVAHGTAPDLAWQGVAETDGLLAAIGVAGRLVDHRAARDG